MSNSEVPVKVYSDDLNPVSSGFLQGKKKARAAAPKFSIFDPSSTAADVDAALSPNW